MFMTAQETRSFLLRDADRYVASMTSADLRARKQTTHVEYKQKTADAARDFTTDEKARLRDHIRQCDDFFRILKPDNPTGQPIDGITMVQIPWVFAKTEGRVLEEGLPHTRENIILLDAHTLQEPPLVLATTLVHEKIHVYQRIYRSLFQQWCRQQGYIRFKPRNTESLIRANPDVDPWIYLGPSVSALQKEPVPMMVRYSSDNPTGIRDVESSAHVLTEHPNEEVAYTMADIFVKWAQNKQSQ